MEIFIAIPPFTQLNCPYPSVPVLTSFLRGLQHNVTQADLGIELADRLFCHNTLEQLFKTASNKPYVKPQVNFVINNKKSYIKNIDGVINFLRGKNSEMIHFYANHENLPCSSQLSQHPDHNKINFDAETQAKLNCTQFIEDISDFITTCIDPFFGLTRYAEKLAQNISHFELIDQYISEKPNYINQILTQKIDSYFQNHPFSLALFSIPFPGNLYGAMVACRHIKNNYPRVKIAIGGGYINTELRNLTDTGIFNYTDFICLDDGFAPLRNIISFIGNNTGSADLIRTYIVENKQVCLKNEDALTPDDYIFVSPDYSGLPLSKYISLYSGNVVLNLWNSQFWNKLNIAHGCYWSHCAFCDTRLDYIKRFQPYKPSEIVETMQKVSKQTASHGFHFTDEAAPPALLKQIALDLLDQNLKFSWWGNIRFEKNFTADFCRLLAASGCIALTGGIETASDRLLQLMEKGTDIETITRVLFHCSQAGILTHAYLMYAFPSQTEREIIDSLEIVRQLFSLNILKSAYWHHFALTVHSTVYAQPHKYGIELTSHTKNPFANNETAFNSHNSINYQKYSKGLAKALYNYMLGNGIDFELYKWFEMRVPQTIIPPNYIRNCLKQKQPSFSHSQTVCYTGNMPLFSKKEKKYLTTYYIKGNVIQVETTSQETEAVKNIINLAVLDMNKQHLQFKDAAAIFENFTGKDFSEWLKTYHGKTLRKSGLLIV